jgi:small subunit ribosomal protein S8
MTDPIADMLTRIRNASAVKKAEVRVPMSKIKHEIAKILKQEGWIQDVKVVKADGSKNRASSFDELLLILKYKKSGKPVISSLKRISKPGLRIYCSKTDLPVVLNGFGIALISTHRGLMTNLEARNQGLGGEIICEIY